MLSGLERNTVLKTRNGSYTYVLQNYELGYELTANCAFCLYGSHAGHGLGVKSMWAGAMIEGVVGGQYVSGLRVSSCTAITTPCSVIMLSHMPWNVVQ